MLEWLQNPYVAIAVAVGAMFFGYFFGLFEGRGQGYKRRQAEEAEKENNDVPETQAEPVQSVEPAMPPDETSLLDVSRDKAGEFCVKLEGQRIEPAAINPEQRKRIIAVLTHIRPWLEPGATSAPQPVRAEPVRSPAPAAEVRASQPTKTSPPPGKTEEEAAAAPGSIVAQIDLILQAQIAGTPLMEKGIRLQESPEGGVLVWVGMMKFEGIEDVPDDQIKTVIREAITAWENKYAPGV
jgi:hypothetical protein